MRHFHQMFVLDRWRKNGIRTLDWSSQIFTGLKKGNVSTLPSLLQGHDQHDKAIFHFIKLLLFCLFVLLLFLCVPFACLFAFGREDYINYCLCYYFYLWKKEGINKSRSTIWVSTCIKNRDICKKAVEINKMHAKYCWGTVWHDSSAQSETRWRMKKHSLTKT